MNNGKKLKAKILFKMGELQTPYDTQHSEEFSNDNYKFNYFNDIKKLN